MQPKEIPLIVFVVGLGCCLVKADGPTNQLANPIIEFGRHSPVDMVANPLKSQRLTHFEVNLELQGDTDIDWQVGSSGLYTNDINGKPVWNTNAEQFWRGVWNDDTMAGGWS